MRRLRRHLLGAITLAAASAALLLALPERSLADPPVFTSIPADILVEAEYSNGSYVEYVEPRATDDNGLPFVSCSPRSGSLFPVGTTRVTCTAEDWQTGEQSTVSFNIRALAQAQERASNGDVTALFYYKKMTDRYGLTVFKNLRLTIVRQGQVVLLQSPVRRWRGDYPVYPGRYGDPSSIAVRDLDRDGEQEVLLDLFWGGAHCCFWSEVYAYTGSRYVPHRHFWGDSGYRITDLDKDGFPEFVSGDYRFAYAFTAFAFSAFPLRLWTYEGGTFADATFSYPAAIRTDAARLWSKRRLSPNGGILAAWAAEESGLGRRAFAFRRLRALARAGKIESDYRPQVYLRRLSRLLNRLGYR